VQIDNKYLHDKIEPFDFENPPRDAIELASELSDFMVEKGGLGLAANQVGLNHRLCIINTQDQGKLAMYNPRIVFYSDDHRVETEGCLSDEFMLVKVRRPLACRVRWHTPQGEQMAHTFSGMISRVIQHEIDHLDGIYFTQRASEINLKKARQRRQNLKKKFLRAFKGAV
jgi:peptide deformylase